jgi:hypothetical protein
MGGYCAKLCQKEYGIQKLKVIEISENRRIVPWMAVLKTTVGGTMAPTNTASGKGR